MFRDQEYLQSCESSETIVKNTALQQLQELDLNRFTL